MQLLFDLVPLIAFVAAYSYGGIYVATGVLIVAVVIQAVVQWVRHRKVSPMMLASAAVVLVFGGLTIAFQDPIFIKWKSTVLYWLFSLAFVLSRFIGDKPLVERIFSEGGICVDRAIWNRANNWYAIFFVLVGALNLYVASRYSEQTWVFFKIVLFVMLAAFTFSVAFWLFSKMPPEKQAGATGNVATDDGKSRDRSP